MRIERYAEERQSEGASGATVNRELSVLRRMFRPGARTTPPRVYRVPSFTQLAESDPRMVFVEQLIPERRTPFHEYWVSWWKDRGRGIVLAQGMIGG